MSLVQTLIPWTVALYLGFAVFYGEEVFDASFQEGFSCGDPIACIGSFFTASFDVVAFLFNFVTLGGFTGILDPAIQLPLLLSFSLPWTIVIVGLLRGSPAS